MGVVYFSIIPTFEPSRYCKCWIVCFYNINATYLSELFVKECGKTFSDIVTDIKMDKAKNMLNEPDARVYEVAVKLGYHDGRYFSQLFKRCTGMTPKEFQKRCDKYE